MYRCSSKSGCDRLRRGGCSTGGLTVFPSQKYFRSIHVPKVVTFGKSLLLGSNDVLFLTVALHVLDNFFFQKLKFKGILMIAEFHKISLLLPWVCFSLTPLPVPQEIPVLFHTLCFS